MNEVMDMIEISKGLAHIAETLVEIAALIDEELCRAMTGECESDWSTARAQVFKAFKSLTPKYEISERLPRNEIGLVALEAMSSLVKIVGAYQRIAFMIDMLREVEFEAIFMDALSSISRKVYESVVALKNMAYAYSEGPNALEEGRKAISRLERQVDEENIIICRQISVATGGHTDYVCYLMRRIVAELEHITDHIQDFAETIEGF